VGELSQQNAALFSELERTKSENSRLKEQVSEVPAGSSDIAATKIKDLAKKNRGLNLMLEREKAKVSKLERELHEAASKPKKAGKGKPGTMGTAPRGEREAAGGESGGANSTAGPVDEVSRLKAEVKEWKEKFSQTNVKVTELRGELNQSNTAAMKMKKALQREVGDGVNLSTVIAGDSTWKGRAEQVALLQQKLKNLKKQFDLHSEIGSTLAPGTPRQLLPGEKPDLDDRHQEEIHKKASERRHDMETMMAEYEKKEGELTELRTKHQAAVARARTLEEEGRKMRGKMQVVLDGLLAVCASIITIYGRCS